MRTKDSLIQEQRGRIKELEGKFQALAGLTAEIIEHKEELSEKYNTALQAKDKLIERLGEELRQLSRHAVDGAFCRDELFKKYIHLKMKLGDITNDPKTHEGVWEIMKKVPISFFWSEVKIVEKRLREHRTKRRIENRKHSLWSRIPDNFF